MRQHKLCIGFDDFFQRYGEACFWTRDTIPDKNSGIKTLGIVITMFATKLYLQAPASVQA